ncbi:MAG: sugar phosphate isomerase/epimerase [Lentisphaerae bacterium]|nr:sugar phosphate isomerase/epimerase [Lentisphaerota bacterium]
MSDHDFTLSRRVFLSGAAALGASAMLPSVAQEAPEKPNSMFNGVQIGCITYSFRSLPGKSAEDLLGYITRCGISSVELMGGPAEGFARAYDKKNPGGDPMDGFKALRRLYSDAGVAIHIVKFGSIGNPKMPEEKIERYFNVAKALGAKGITREISEPAAKRLGPIADKHEIMIGFHNHMQLTPTTYDGDILSYGKYLGINLDIGHYVAGTNQDPIALIEKHHERILSLHLKDRKLNKGPNMPFGQGETPIAGVLQFMAKNKLTFPADVELEYRVPKESGAVEEISKCVQFCKDALVG